MPCVQLEALDLLLGGRPGPLQDLLELVDGGGACEERLPPQHLSKHAAHAPDVN